MKKIILGLVVLVFVGCSELFKNDLQKLKIVNAQLKRTVKSLKTEIQTLKQEQEVSLIKEDRIKNEIETNTNNITPIIVAMAMNVMYVGVDNPVSVSVPGYNPDQIQPSLGGSGTMRKGKYGKKDCYIARVTKPGKTVRINLILSDVDEDGNVKKSNVKGPEFRVKRVPDPVFTLGNKYKGGKIQAGRFRVQGGIVPKLENFDFKFRFKTQSYEMIYIPKGMDAVVFKAKGQAFSKQIKKYIRRAKPKDRYFFSDVKVKGDDGTVRTLPSCAFDIIG